MHIAETEMKKYTVTGLAIVLMLALAALAFAEDLGQVNIPRSVKLKGSIIQSGQYTFSLDKSGDKVMIHLKQGGQVVASELAVTKPADKISDTAYIVYQPLRRDGSNDPVLSRILCSYQGTLYLLYFEKP